MARRGIPLTESDRRIYERVFEVAAGYKGLASAKVSDRR